MRFIAVFGMLLGDTLILDDLDCANRYRQEVTSTADAVSQLIRQWHLTCDTHVIL